MSIFKSFKENFLPINRRILKRELGKQNEEFDKKLDVIIKKLGMPDNIWQINEVKFFVPNYPLDEIQAHIVNSSLFFDQDVLDDLKNFLPENPVICDIGSNIGNHTLYWLSKSNAQFVYCFEPRHETFQILEKNIQINNFSERTKTFNLALSDKESKLSTRKFRSSNIGANCYEENESGEIKSIMLDSLDIQQKIDLMKIDVEDMETYVLQGAKETIRKYKPLIFVELIRNYNEVISLLASYGYSLIKEYPKANYLFTHQQK